MYKYNIYLECSDISKESSDSVNGFLQVTSIFFIFSPKEFYHEKLLFLEPEKVVEHDMQFFMKKNRTQENRENKLSFSFIRHVTNK